MELCNSRVDGWPGHYWLERAQTLRGTRTETLADSNDCLKMLETLDAQSITDESGWRSQIRNILRQQLALNRAHLYRLCLQELDTLLKEYRPN